MFFDTIKMTKLKEKKKRKKKSMAITVTKPRCGIVSSQFIKQIRTFQKLTDAVRRTLTEQHTQGFCFKKLPSPFYQVGGVLVLPRCRNDWTNPACV